METHNLIGKSDPVSFGARARFKWEERVEREDHVRKLFITIYGRFSRHILYNLYMNCCSDRNRGKSFDLLCVVGRYLVVVVVAVMLWLLVRLPHCFANKVTAQLLVFPNMIARVRMCQRLDMLNTSRRGC